MNDTLVLGGDCRLETYIDGELSLAPSFGADAGLAFMKREFAYPIYNGPTAITPGTSPQTLNTTDTTVLSDITIGAIPQNYGLITWDGSTLTVS